jgi:SAM-dependent methyltransferase
VGIDELMYACTVVSTQTVFFASGSRQASAERLGLGDCAVFYHAELTRTGLADGSADALLCVDAFHFASSPIAAARECRLLLKPGGRVVMTTWQPSGQDPVDRVPERIGRMNIRRDLDRAGFAEIEVLSRPGWLRTEAAFWTAASRVDPGATPR